jgi:hypothetical protein
MPRKTLDFVCLKGDISVVMIGGETKYERLEKASNSVSIESPGEERNREENI